MERLFFAMHPYEAMFILQPGLGDEGVNGFVGKVTGLLTENGAELGECGQLVDRRGTVVATTEGWKTRRLTYPIKGRNEGYYAVFAFKGTAKTLDSLDRAVRYDESVIRHMVLRKDEAKPAA